MRHQTNRVYTNVETKEPFALWYDPETGEYSLVSEGTERHAKGTEVNGFYLSQVPLEIKLNGKKAVKLEMGEFYNLKEGEVVTHRKYEGGKFTKI